MATGVRAPPKGSLVDGCLKGKRLSWLARRIRLVRVTAFQQGNHVTTASLGSPRF